MCTPSSLFEVKVPRCTSHWCSSSEPVIRPSPSVSSSPPGPLLRPVRPPLGGRFVFACCVSSCRANFGSKGLAAPGCLHACLRLEACGNVEDLFCIRHPQLALTGQWIQHRRPSLFEARLKASTCRLPILTGKGDAARTPGSLTGVGHTLAASDMTAGRGGQPAVVRTHLAYWDA